EPRQRARPRTLLAGLHHVHAAPGDEHEEPRLSAAAFLKGRSMPFSRIAENRIREAMEQGQFENLPGAGQPLNLDEYFSAPEDLRMAYSILRSANCAPVEVQ